MSEQLSLEDYARIQSEAVSETRVQFALELTRQAEELLRHSEHHTFDSAIALLLKLREGEPANSNGKQQVSDRIASKVNHARKPTGSV
jgi:hypothetical protein